MEFRAVKTVNGWGVSFGDGGRCAPNQFGQVKAFAHPKDPFPDNMMQRLKTAAYGVKITFEPRRYGNAHSERRREFCERMAARLNQWS